MSSHLKETLSAVVDGEASDFEARRLIEEAGRSPELRSLWSRYHLIGASMRREGEVVDSSAALDRFWTAIDAMAETGDDTTLVPGAKRSFRPGRVTGAAVAAVVALGVVVMFGVGTPRSSDLPGGVAGLENSMISNVPSLGIPAQGILTTPEPRFATRRLPTDSDVHRAQAYMLHHAHQTALNQRPTGSVPFVKVAAFESR